MNISTLIGFLTAIVVFLLSTYLSVGNPLTLFDPNSILIVFGGTIAATLICFPLDQIVPLLKVFFRRILGRNKKDHGDVILQVVELSRNSLLGKKQFEEAVKRIREPFLKDAADMLFWLKSDITPEELRDLLETRAQTHYKQYMGEAKIFKTISKFPPAFGMIGTALGIVALLQSLSDPGAKNKIGPAMAIALITTIYGLALNNFLIVPIAENLMKQTKDDLLSRMIVVEGIMLIQEEKPTRYIEEKLKSFLLPGQRLKMENGGGPGSAGMPRAA